MVAVELPIIPRNMSSGRKAIALQSHLFTASNIRINLVGNRALRLSMLWVLKFVTDITSES